MTLELFQYFLFFALILGCLSCLQKSFNQSSVVCVCSASQCSLPGLPVALKSGQANLYINSKSGVRFQYKTISNGELCPIGSDTQLKLNTTKTYQTIIGFGGSFTDSAGLNIKSLSEDAQQQLIRAYFSKEGANYNLCRLPIAGTDCSTRPYSYDDVQGDYELKHFALQEEDHLYKIPYIKQAIATSDQDIFLLASPWSPPSWMKTNQMFNGSGYLMQEMYQPWANYFIKFIEAYESELGIQLWGVTTQNEPLTGNQNMSFNACGWSASDMADWIASHLGPSLEAAGLRRVKLLVVDSNRYALPWFARPIFELEANNLYVDGIAVHWYLDKLLGPEVLDETHAEFPDKFMLYSESAIIPPKRHPEDAALLGSWERGEDYILNIIENLNHWQSGWIDWNLALDLTGGPNWANNVLDSSIIIDSEKDEFYLQPMYVAMTHFSKYIQRDAKRIDVTLTGDDSVHSTAVINPDKTVVVVLANKSKDSKEVQLTDSQANTFYIVLEPHSWASMQYMA